MNKWTIFKFENNSWVKLDKEFFPSMPYNLGGAIMTLSLTEEQIKNECAVINAYPMGRFLVAKN